MCHPCRRHVIHDVTALPLPSMISACAQPQHLPRWRRGWRPHPGKQCRPPLSPPCSRHAACAAAGSGAGSVTIVGLGPGDPALLTREALEVLTAAPLVHVRTATHPTLALLTLQLRSFDEVYESEETLQDVYPRIVDDLADRASTGEAVTYAVPGDACVAEMTVKLLRDRATVDGFQLRIVPGVSFLEPTLAALGLDLLPSLYVGDALVVAEAAHPPFSACQPVLLSQLYSRAVASDVKLTLMNQYPDSHRCALVHDAGGVGTCVEWLPVHSIDFSTRIGPRTSLYVPPLDGTASWEDVMDAQAKARDGLWGPWAEGDPTHSDAAAALVDAATRAASAADEDDPQALQDALADVLQAVALHAHVAADEGQFNGRDLLTAAAERAREGHGAADSAAPAMPAGRGYIVEEDESEDEEE